jgi:hypothetical protein
VQFNGGYGVVQGPGDNERPQTERREGALSGNGTDLAAYARFTSPNVKNEFVITVRIGTSFISTTQARANIDAEIPDGKSIEETKRETEEKWQEKLGRFEVEGGSEDDKTVFWTGVFHALQVSEHPLPFPFPFYIYYLPILLHADDSLEFISSIPMNNSNPPLLATTPPMTIKSTPANHTPAIQSGIPTVPNGLSLSYSRQKGYQIWYRV